MKKSSSVQSVLNSFAESKQHLSTLGADFRTRFRSFRHGRSVSGQQSLTEDFGQVLVAWGIDGVEAIPGVVRVLRLRFLVFLVPVIACSAATAWLPLALVMLPCLFGVVTTAWRISILKNHRFLPLSRWILSGFGLVQKRS